MTKLKVTQEVKDTWIEALRSGEYEQAQNTLRSVSDVDDTEGLCCLGVLNDVAAEDAFWFDCGLVVCDSPSDKKRIIRRKTDCAGKPIERIGQYCAMDGVSEICTGALTPFEFRFADGYRKAVPNSYHSNPLTLLTSLNDAHNWSFEMIADFLEEYLLVDEDD